jgi:hypothetical protein
VKYMLLIYDGPGTRELFWGQEGRALMDRVDAILGELRDSGELVGTQGLADPTTARSVRLQDGAPVVSDGPFAEAKEQLGGYLIVDCALERALEIASRWPFVGTNGIEVRPVMFDGGAEM